jgi:hypothetical protein
MPAVRQVTAVQSGDLLVGYGAEYSSGYENPLSGLEGNLLSPAVVSIAYGFADRAVVEVWGSYQVLYIRSAGPPLVDLDPGADSGTTSDFGDFHVATRFALAGTRRGFSAGLDLDVKLPSSDEQKGIGTNSTDIRLGLLAGFGASQWRLDADLGVVILEAPAEDFEQNDQFAYAAELLYRPEAWRLRLALGVSGRANTRTRVPEGTEDRGEVALGADYRAGGFLIDAAVSVGYGAATEWSVRAGVSHIFQL